MKNLLKKLLIGILVFYFIPAFMFFTPYYNWQYAKTHGFIKWFLFGEVVATAKAMAWPYFVFVKSKEDISQSQRDTILKGIFYMCMEGAPAQITERFGPMAVKRFCSCYTDEIANSLTKEQFDAMIIDPNTGRSRVPPNYSSLVDKANRVCAGELNSR
ncbi:MAG: hypothetical protein A2Y48_07695 [Nitrospirae bacterium RIFCSPLOW2_12_42_9]|nr:MAG: hypothetical protein A2Y48_07695 [Nitrospirae bacterium RIFCSPLOW2_12_42_9]